MYKTKIEKLLLTELIEMTGNPQKMDDWTFNGLVSSMKKKGWYMENMTVWQRPNGGGYQIISGHHRCMAAIEAGITKTVCNVIVDEQYTDEQARKDCIEANQRHGKQDEDELKIFMSNLLDSSDLNIDDIIKDIGISDDIFKEIKENSKFRASIDEEEIKVPIKEQNINIYKWINSFEVIYVMFSGGKDSMAMVADLLMNNIKKKKMKLLFNKTPLDYKDLERFVTKFSQEVDIPIDIIGVDMSENEKQKMFERNGFPLPWQNWCTGIWKVKPMRDYFKNNNLLGKDNIIICQGWRREESKQRENAGDRVIHKVHKIRIARPIMEYKEKEVYNIIENMNWKLHHCYEYRKRLSCIFCHAVKRKEWDKMREKDPKEFLRALSYVADGFLSENITAVSAIRKTTEMLNKDEIEFRSEYDISDISLNCIRKMLGKNTINKQKKENKKEEKMLQRYKDKIIKIISNTKEGKNIMEIMKLTKGKSIKYTEKCLNELIEEEKIYMKKEIYYISD